MTDREYVKINTSLQTASNTGQNRQDEFGNIEAAIELRLPDNFFKKATGATKVDKVSMQTSKMRLSMENTPIAQIPMNTTLYGKFDEKILISDCEMDIWPFCLLDDKSIQPKNIEETAFPYYKHHKISYEIVLHSFDEGGEVDTTQVIRRYSGITNTSGFGAIPSSSLFYDMIDKVGLMDVGKRLMNLSLTKDPNRSVIEVDETKSTVLLKSISALEHMIQDGIENAIQFASTDNEIIITIDVVSAENMPSTLDPPPDTSISVELNEYASQDEPITVYYWKHNITNGVSKSYISSACKPDITIDQESLSLSYDSAPFNNNVPIIWNSSFINTYDVPPQIKLDKLRNNFTTAQPPPKRVYRYNVQVNEDGIYSYTIPESANCSAMNIICNEDTKNTISFLPWMEINLNEIQSYRDALAMKNKYEVKYEKTVHTEHTEGFTNCRLSTTRAGNDVFDESIRAYSCTGQGSYDQSVTNTVIKYIYVLPEGKSDIPGNRIDQRIMYGTSTEEGIYQDEVHFPDGYDFPQENYNSIDDVTDTTETIEKYNCYSTPFAVGGEEINSENTSNTEMDEDTTLGPMPITIRENSYMPDYYVLEFLNVPALPNVSYIAGINLNYYPGAWNDRYPTRWIPPWEPSRHRINGTDHTVEWDIPDPMPIDPDTGTTAALIKIYYGYPVYRHVNFFTSDVSMKSVTRTVTDLLPGDDFDINIIPNLDLDSGNKFYLLNGTSAEVEIGSQEVIDLHGNMTLFNVTEITRNTVFKDERTLVTNREEDGPDTPMTEVSYFNEYVPEGMSRPVTRPPPTTFIALYYRPNIDAPTHRFCEIVGGTSVNNSYPNTWTPEAYRVITDVSTGYITYPQPVIEESYTSDNPALIPGTSTTTSTSPVEDTGLVLKQNKFEPNDCERYFWKNGSWQLGRNIYTDSDYRMYGEAVSDHPGSKFIPNWPSDYHYVQQSWRGHSDYSLDLWIIPNDEHSFVKDYYAVRRTYKETKTYTESEYTVIVERNNESDQYYKGNVRLNFTWTNLPTVILSPISAIVLTLDGMQVTQEFQPINITSYTGSSLTSTIPVIENFYSLAQTIRDLHDELVVVKEDFDSTATYSVATVSGQERSIRINAKYITKDGKLHSIFVPPDTGVFNLQIIFGVDLVYI